MEISSVPLIGQPTRWIVCFDRYSPSRWINLLAFGRYKHVRAFGHVPGMDLWLFYDVRFSGTVIGVARGDGARKIMNEWAATADLVGVAARAQSRPGLGLYCVPAIRHLLGLPGGTWLEWPDGLYRSCLAHGGERIDDDGPAAASSRSDVLAVAAEGAERSDQGDPEPATG